MGTNMGGNFQTNMGGNFQTTGASMSGNFGSSGTTGMPTTEIKPVFESSREKGNAVYVDGAPIEVQGQPRVNVMTSEERVSGAVSQQVVEIPTEQVIENVVE